MRLIRKSYVQLTQKEIEAVKGMEEIIFNLASQFHGACKANGEIEDEAVDNCNFFSEQLLRAYNEFVDTLRTYGNFE